MKQIAGITATICGIVVAVATASIAMLWWTTSDMIKELRQR
jgi:hypothetical protein